MSQRERSRSGEATPAPDAALAIKNGHAGAALNWDALFPALSPAQQQALQELTKRQELLRAQPVPIPANDSPSADRAREFFHRLLHGQALHLPALALQDLSWFDPVLDADQRAAVALAVQTPDVALIQGSTGTGKSRVIAEIIRHATSRGQRALFVSPTPAALDVVLERLQHSPHGLPLRCLIAEERAERLPEASRNCTWPAYERLVREEAVRQSERRCRELEQRLARLQADEPILTQLGELASRRHQLQQQIDELDRRSNLIPDAVRHLASGQPPDNADPSFHSAVSERQREHQRNLGELELAATDLRKQAAMAQAELEAIENRIHEFEPLAEAQEHTHWFSFIWWKRRKQAKKLGDVAARIRQEQEQLQAVRKQLESLTRAQMGVAARRQSQEREWQSEREQRVNEEIARRQQLLAGEKADLLREEQLLEANWRLAKRQLSADAPQPSECLVSIHDACRSELPARISQTKAEWEQTRAWLESLRHHAHEFLTRLREAIQVVAMPLSACADDKQFAEIGRNLFDLLIVDDAHLLAEEDLGPALRRAGRWVLVGEPAAADLAEKAAPRRSAAHSRRDGPNGAGKREFLPRLAHVLHRPVWQHEGKRLRCRLMSISAEQRARLEVEPVADSPEIELHILCTDNSAPTLAEVTFPASIPLEHAKLFLFRELEEVPVPGGIPRWQEDAGQIRIVWSELAGTMSVELVPGVREYFCNRAPGQTIAICFDKSVGWDRARAEPWLQRHIRPVDAGRALWLHRWHRPAPALAAILMELGVAGPRAAAHSDPAEAPAVEFIPVPGLQPDAAHRRRGAEQAHNGLPRRLPAMRGGGGLELDLADAKHRDRLSPDLRDALPQRGFVNLAEAQAILRLLDNQLEDWTRLSPNGLHVAILTSYPAQAELMRQLLKREAIAIPKPIRLTVDYAGDFQHQECELAVISLTRSHERRAVPFGDNPLLVPFALTRARKRIIFVGDPGTLCRRSQWEGPLDHLDEALAFREKSWVTALVKNLQGAGPASILLHEGPP
ncbi:MAG TPA: AAA domain-containing protein [Gemmataceae bacterium]|jgi:hypothetical protein|nr:AAA domain-containing protein [Gemmataceae bacterium]